MSSTARRIAHPRRTADGQANRRGRASREACAAFSPSASARRAARVGEPGPGRRAVTALGWASWGRSRSACWSGTVLGWLELIAIAWACLMLLLVAASVPHRPQLLRIRLSLPLSRVVVGDRPRRASIVANPSRRRIAGVPLEVPVGEGLAEFDMPGPGARRGVRARSSASRPSTAASSPSAPCAPCAPIPSASCGGSSIWSRARRAVRAPAHRSASPRSAPASCATSRESPTRDLTASDVSFHALREYDARRRPAVHPLEVARRRPAPSWCASSRRPAAATSWSLLDLANAATRRRGVRAGRERRGSLGVRPSATRAPSRSSVAGPADDRRAHARVRGDARAADVSRDRPARRPLRLERDGPRRRCHPDVARAAAERAAGISSSSSSPAPARRRRAARRRPRACPPASRWSPCSAATREWRRRAPVAGLTVFDDRLPRRPPEASRERRPSHERPRVDPAARTVVAPRHHVADGRPPCSPRR